MMPQQTNVADSQQQLQQWMFMPYPAATMVMQHPHYHQMIPYQLFPPQSFIVYASIPHYREQSHQGSSSEENRTIWVGDLHYWMQENYLHSCFAHTERSLPLSHSNKQTGQSKGYGFVEFLDTNLPDVTDTLLQGIYASRYPSVRGAKVVIDANIGRSKGYGFVRFGDDNERTLAIKEMNGVYCSSRLMCRRCRPQKVDWFQQMSSQGMCLL
ncbi:hypothetical protein MKX03_015932 [Papaver bracteatum]|nr:hypothetical protein MKX03_015932 [Papaver bracteatum]